MAAPRRRRGGMQRLRSPLQISAGCSRPVTLHVALLCLQASALGAGEILTPQLGGERRVAAARVHPEVTHVITPGGGGMEPFRPEQRIYFLVWKEPKVWGPGFDVFDLSSLPFCYIRAPNQV